MPLTAIPVTETLYQECVNPQWVRLLDVLQMNVRYTRCQGTELDTEDGRRILDFLSGYCVHNAGHNHPAIVAAACSRSHSMTPIPVIHGWIGS